MSFLRSQAQAALGVNEGALLDAAEKLQKRGQLLNLGKGFYVAVPPQYHNFGSPSPSSFIDDLMRNRNRPYCVGLLKAAELHGASQQAVTEFQVVTDKQMRSLRAGRANIVFYFKKDLSLAGSAIEDYKTDTGKMKISSVELTVLDLLRYPKASGWLDNILTVVADLAPKLDSEKIAALQGAFERSLFQRAGYLLDRAGLRDQAEKLRTLLASRPPLQWIELDPSLRNEADFTPEIQSRDKRWRVIVRRLPEGEE